MTLEMKIKTDFFPQQQEAYDKLVKLRIGALYMVMGTGKTRVALELIKNRLERGKINNILWLCPCSVKADMRENIRYHTEDDGLINIYGIESLSKSDRLYLKLLEMVAKKDTFLVVDESNLVKNYFAKRTARITALAESCPYRIILNGTPISKNEADLFAQWYILDKRILGYNSFWSFAANHLEYDDYGRVRRTLHVDYLTEKIAPYSYIIENKDALNLPKKRYKTAFYYLSQEQSYEYENTKDLLLSNIDEFDSTTIYKLFTGLQQVVSGNRITEIEPLTSVPMFRDPLDNPRVQTLLDEIENLEGKVIVWCKFTQEIRDIEKVLTDKYGQQIALFYGDIKPKQRQKELDRFRNEARFLLANKACGGYGLNLQFCSNMIYYSNDFNWATRAQSEDRVHRIGQTKEVNIIDICAYSKVDARILNNLNHKENLANWFKRELKKNKQNISKWIDGKDVM